MSRLRRNLPVGAALALLAIPGVATFHADISALIESSFDFVALLSLLGHLMATTFMLSAAGYTILRLAPRRETVGLRAAISAVSGSFLLVGLNLIPQQTLPSSLAILSAALVALGYLAATVSLTHLGRSFAILPAARQLVTSGPYRFVRHPLYLAEELAAVGLLIHYASPFAAALVVLHFLLQVDRMLHEERVLGDTFPDYAGYARRTARLVPGIW